MAIEHINAIIAKRRLYGKNSMNKSKQPIISKEDKNGFNRSFLIMPKLNFFLSSRFRITNHRYLEINVPTETPTTAHIIPYGNAIFANM